MKCDFYGEIDWIIVISSIYIVYLLLKLFNFDIEILKLFKYVLSGFVVFIIMIIIYFCFK